MYTEFSTDRLVKSIELCRKDRDWVQIKIDECMNQSAGYWVRLFNCQIWNAFKERDEFLLIYRYQLKTINLIISKMEIEIENRQTNAVGS